jgi:hypothetical protein
MMRSTYLERDVTILLKDITNGIIPQDTFMREQYIQGGGHYSEMLPIEYEPTQDYLRLYTRALENFAPLTAAAVKKVSEKIYNLHGKNTALVSLARAGTPVGVLIKRYAEMKYHCVWPHYTISIIRGKGIDHNAIKYILARHEPQALQFVDGWTGKGTINGELNKAVAEYPGVSGILAVLSDPAFLTTICGTHKDFLIPHSCLNATVTGLMSRTVLNSALIKENDFHGAVFYENLLSEDRSYEFINKIEAQYPVCDDYLEVDEGEAQNNPSTEVQDIAKKFGISDIHLIKPSIGEATRVLLRRLPWKLLVHSLEDEYYLGHLYQLAQEKNIPLTVYPLTHYRACGIIRELS